MSYSQDMGGYTGNTDCLPNAVGTFNHPSASVSVYKKFVWVLSGFIEMLIKNICKNLKNLSSQGAALTYHLKKIQGFIRKSSVTISRPMSLYSCVSHGWWGHMLIVSM